MTFAILALVQTFYSPIIPSCERIPELAEVNGFFSEDEVMTTFVVGNFCLLQNRFCSAGGEVQAETQGLRGRVGQGDCLVQAGLLQPF